MSNYLFIDYDESNALGVYKVKQGRIALDWIKIKQDLSIIKDKIVLIGFVGKDKNSINEYVEELYSTPLRNNALEYKIPNMYGVVIHANIISMFINNDNVIHIKFWSDFVNILILIAFIFMLQFIHSKFKSYDQFIDRGISLLVIYLLIRLSIILFSLNIYIDFTRAVFWLLFSTDLNELYVKTYIPVYDSLSIAKRRVFIVIPIIIFLALVFSKFLQFSDFVDNLISLFTGIILIVYFLGLASYGYYRKSQLNDK